MQVKELRKLLKNMPGEMNVYAVSGNGIASAKHIFKANLSGVEQFCELRTYFEDHTPQFQDTLIERETGFQDRRELIDAYKELKAQSDRQIAPQPAPEAEANSKQETGQQTGA